MNLAWQQYQLVPEDQCFLNNLKYSLVFLGGVYIQRAVSYEVVNLMEGFFWGGLIRWEIKKTFSCPVLFSRVEKSFLSVFLFFLIFFL